MINGYLEIEILSGRERNIFVYHVAFACWIFWKVRCEASVNGEILDALKTVIRIHKSVGESGGVCFRNLGRDAMKVMFRSNAKWWKLEDGYFKVDADGAFMKKSLKVVVGVIIRIIGDV